MRLNQRQERILLSLKKLDYLSREQIQIMHELGGERNAQRIMKRLEPYVSVMKQGQHIYYLNANGRDIVACEKVRKKLTDVTHYLMRNDLYIQAGQPDTWKNEIRIKNGDVKVVADALYKTDRYNIVEIDHTQKMNKNMKKLERYRELIKRNAFKGQPRVIWVTTTEYRQERLRELCKGLDAFVYLHKDFK